MQLKVKAEQRCEQQQERAETSKHDLALLVNVIRQLQQHLHGVDAKAKEAPKRKHQDGWFDGRLAGLLANATQAIELAAHATRAADPNPEPLPEPSHGLKSLDPKIYAQILQAHAHIQDEGEVQRRMERAVLMLGRHAWQPDAGGQPWLLR